MGKKGCIHVYSLFFFSLRSEVMRFEGGEIHLKMNRKYAKSMRISDFFHHTIVTRTCRTWFPSCFYDFLHFPANNCLLIRLLTDSILFYMHSHWIFFINVPHTETHHINWKKFSKNKGQKEGAREKNWQLSLTTIQKVTKTKRDHTNRACWFYVPLISLFSILFFLTKITKWNVVFIASMSSSEWKTSATNLWL